MAPDHGRHFVPEGRPLQICPQERGSEVPLLRTRGQQRVTRGFAQCSLAGGISVTCKRARNANSRPHARLAASWTLGVGRQSAFPRAPRGLAHSRLTTPNVTAGSVCPRAGWPGSTPSSARWSLTTRLWTKTSLCLSFPICRMGIVIVLLSLGHGES